MVSLAAEKIGKKFYRHWIFRDISFHLEQGQTLLLTGPNGSGKSTLIRIIAGQLSPSRGDIILKDQGKQLPYEDFYKLVSWAAPYIELYPDLTLREMVKLHFQFKKCLLPSGDEVIKQLRLQGHENKILRHFSSGMMHRVKVGLAVFSQSKILILDEATTNMDQNNSDYVFELLDQHQGERILIFASNNQAEFDRFDHRLEL